MAGRSFDIVAIGEALVEFNQVAQDDPRHLRGFGGDTSNAMIAAARSGGKTAYLTRVGADAFGDALIELWRKEGVDTRGVAIDSGAPTGSYVVDHHTGRHRFTYRRAGSAASRMTAENVSLDLIADSRVLHCSGISQAISDSAAETVERAIALAHEHGTVVSYDPNLRVALWPVDRARPVIEATLSLADIALPSLDDTQLLAGIEEVDAALDYYLGLGPTVVALTLGGEGAAIATPQRRERFSVSGIMPVDATGAGDAFDGAFLIEYLKSGDPFRAGAYAVMAAAMATEGFGAVAPIPRREEVLARIESAARRAP